MLKCSLEAWGTGGTLGKNCSFWVDFVNIDGCSLQSFFCKQFNATDYFFQMACAGMSAAGQHCTAVHCHSFLPLESKCPEKGCGRLRNRIVLTSQLAVLPVSLCFSI